jgi:hypothetical protein
MSASLNAVLPLAVILALVWMATEPPAHLQRNLNQSTPFYISVDQGFARVQRDLVTQLGAERIELPRMRGADSVVFLNKSVGLSSGFDGLLWQFDLDSRTDKVLLTKEEIPGEVAMMMVSESDPDIVYFCTLRPVFPGMAAKNFSERDIPGLYKLHVQSREITPIPTRLPAEQRGWHQERLGHPADAASFLVEELETGSMASRPICQCNNLQIANDGRSIYFTESYTYGGTVDFISADIFKEIITQGQNGHLWEVCTRTHVHALTMHTLTYFLLLVCIIYY